MMPGLDVLGRRARPRDAHRHGRVVDVGELADADARDRDDAEQDRPGHDHPREDRPFEADVGDVHGAASVAPAAPPRSRLRRGVRTRRRSAASTRRAAGAPASLDAASSVVRSVTFTGAPSVSGSKPARRAARPPSSPCVTSTPPSGVCMPSVTLLRVRDVLAVDDVDDVAALGRLHGHRRDDDASARRRRRAR